MYTTAPQRRFLRPPQVSEDSNALCAQQKQAQQEALINCIVERAQRCVPVRRGQGRSGQRPGLSQQIRPPSPAIGNATRRCWRHLWGVVDSCQPFKQILVSHGQSLAIVRSVFTLL